MPRDWEAQFRDWAKPPGKTEEDRCSNAVSVTLTYLTVEALDEVPADLPAHPMIAGDVQTSRGKSE